MTELKGDTQAAIAFLKLWAPQGPWVVTAITPTRTGINTQTFKRGQEAELITWIDGYQGTRNIYFTVNPVRHAVSSKPSREDIKELAWLHVDVDPEPREDFQEERKRIRSLFSERLPKGVPLPTVVIDSGGGFQAFWKLETPFPINGEVDKYEEAKRWNQQLEILFNADNCHNVDRIMRLPGTLNVPDEKKRKKHPGRDVALAGLDETTDWTRVYPFENFTPAPKRQEPGLERGAGFGKGQEVEVSENTRYLAHIDELGDDVPDWLKVLINQGYNPGQVYPDYPAWKWPSRSEPFWLALNELKRIQFAQIAAKRPVTVSDEVIYSVFMDPGFLLSAHVRDQKNPRRYLLNQIQKAHETAIDPALAEMNAKYAVIKNFGGKCVVVTEEVDPTHNRSILTAMSFEDINKAYVNRKVVVGKDKEDKDVKMPLGKWWLQHELRRQFNNVIFAPNREIEGSYNQWKGFAVVAKPGTCEKFIAHIRDNICGADPRSFEHLIKYMSWTVQYPACVGEIAIVLRGPQGTGKSFFAKQYGSLWGRHFLQVANPSHLVGNFNAHLEDCIVLFADEAFFAGDKRHESILKTLVTEENILIERKRIDAKMRNNFVHLIMASDGDWVVPANIFDRRFFVLDVLKNQMQNSDYFAAIADELDNGGREALLHYLLTMDIKGFNPRDFPRTDALRDQKVHSLGGENKIIFDMLSTGELPFFDVDEQFKWVFVPTAKLLKDAEDRGQVGKGKLHHTTLSKALRRLRGERIHLQLELLDDRTAMDPDSWFNKTTANVVDRTNIFGNLLYTVGGMWLPPLNECRANWLKVMEWPHADWGPNAPDEWLCIPLAAKRRLNKNVEQSSPRRKTPF